MDLAAQQHFDMRQRLVDRAAKYRVGQRKFAGLLSEMTGEPVPARAVGSWVLDQLRGMEMEDLFRVSDWLFDNDNRSGTQRANDMLQADLHNRRYAD